MFQINQKVICIDDTMRPHTIEELKKDMPNWVKKGNKYTIRGFTDNNGIVDGLWLEEVRNQPLFFKLLGRPQEPAFAFWRFRAMQEDEVFVEERKAVKID